MRVFAQEKWLIAAWRRFKRHFWRHRSPEVQSLSQPMVCRSLQRNRLVDQHDRMFADGVEELAICADQAAGNLFFDSPATAIFQRPRRDLLVDPVDQRWFSFAQRLMRFRTTHDL